MKILQQRRKEILDKILDQAIDRQYELEVGIEIKESMLMESPEHEAAPKIQQIINEERFMLDNQLRAIDILSRKLMEMFPESDTIN